MPILDQFDPPANWEDFKPGETELRNRFRSEWNRRVICWFQTSLIGNAWQVDNDHPRSNFVNPLGSEVPITPHATVPWTAFPKRLKDRFETPPPPEQPRTREEILRFGDDGPPIPWRPDGPRGWQDEYCEWAVERNSAGKIIKVSFTCENPEYWEALWFISPEKVLELYRKYLEDNTIQLEDLYARDQQNQPIIDRETGRAAYARRNPWNRNQFDNGHNKVMHLISTPNNLFAEIYLAGGSSTLRVDSSGNNITDKDILIECGRYGQPGRNSDPTIGFGVNNKVLQNNSKISLANPVGLYLAGLDTDLFTLPPQAPNNLSPADFWKVIRGTPDMILRAEYFVPEGLGFVVGDIEISGDRINFGSQIAEHIQVKLSANLSPGTAAPAQRCLVAKGNPLPQANSFFDPNGQLRTRRFLKGTSTNDVLLACTDTPSTASIEIDGTGVIIDVTDQFQTQNGLTVFVVDVKIDSNAEVKIHSISLRVNGVLHPEVPCLLEVVDWLPTLAPPFPFNVNRIREVGRRIDQIMTLPRGDSGT